MWFYRCQNCGEETTSEKGAGWHERDNKHQMEVVYPEPVT